MTGLLTSARLIDIVLLLTGVEAVCVVLYRHRTKRGPPAGDFLVTLLAGVFLLLALRCALSGAGPGWLALCLLGALGAHVADVWRRWG